MKVPRKYPDRYFYVQWQRWTIWLMSFFKQLFPDGTTLIRGVEHDILLFFSVIVICPFVGTYPLGFSFGWQRRARWIIDLCAFYSSRLCNNNYCGVGKFTSLGNKLMKLKMWSVRATRWLLRWIHRWFSMVRLAQFNISYSEKVLWSENWLYHNKKYVQINYIPFHGPDFWHVLFVLSPDNPTFPTHTPRVHSDHRKHINITLLSTWWLVTI